MQITLFGATGTLGQRLLTEAMHRGHEITAVVRDPFILARQENQHLRVVEGDVLDPQSVAAAAAGQDAVLSAVGPRPDQSPDLVVDSTRALIAGLTQAGVKRLVVVGGAGSLEVAPGVHLVDTPAFPAAWRPVALAHRAALAIFRKEAGAFDWTYVSPAALIAPGKRTGQFRVGGDQLLTDAQGESHISAEDYAVAVLDEIEKPQHIRQRITVAY